MCKKPNNQPIKLFMLFKNGNSGNCKNIRQKNITSSGEKKATASGSIVPTGCNETIALNIEGNNNSITATLSAATVFCNPGLSLLEL